jgi:hypothetical protein
VERYSRVDALKNPLVYNIKLLIIKQEKSLAASTPRWGTLAAREVAQKIKGGIM